MLIDIETADTDIETDDSKDLFFHVFCHINFKVRIYFSEEAHKKWTLVERYSKKRASDVRVLQQRTLAQIYTWTVSLS